MSIRERTEAFERKTLSKFAAFSGESAGRKVPEPEDEIRTCFQRDRDRILHCKSFRRLMHKTQVFIQPKGDHYRTRLTHSLEVAQIARTIARAVRLNEDLTEAIALGHDVGHTPFGHAGEAALNDAVLAAGSENGFKHYEQSVRVLTVLENDRKGLNLCLETVAGIGGHSKGRADLQSGDTERSSSLEAEVVRVADRIAYLNHDLDDAFRAGWFQHQDIPQEIAAMGRTQGERIGFLVQDLIETSADSPSIRFSEDTQQRINLMKEFLFEKLYHEYPRRFPDVEKAQKVVTRLFQKLLDDPKALPSGFEGLQGAIDYVSGMTDRFALWMHEQWFGERVVIDEDGRIAST